MYHEVKDRSPLWSQGLAEKLDSLTEDEWDELSRHVKRLFNDQLRLTGQKIVRRQSYE